MRTLAAAMLAVALPAASASAEPDPAPPARAPAADDRGVDETIVVVGLRLPRPVVRGPAAATGLEREELRRAPQVVADDVVRALPSLATFRRSSSLVADPSSQGVNLRGVGPSAVSRALVLRDGVPASDPFGGWMYWRSVRMLDVDRVEVVPGGSSASFGDVALGGALDLVSRPITPRTIEALIAGGTQGTARGAVRASDVHGGLGLAIDGEALRTAGYAPIAPDQRGPIDGPAASDHQAAGVRLEHRRGSSELRANVGWFREHLDAGTAFTTADVRSLTWAAGWRLARDAGTFAVDVFGGDELFRQTRARVAMGRTSASLASRQRTPSSSQGALVTWTATTGRHAWIAGVDVRRVAGTATDALSPAMVEPDSLVLRAAGGEQQSAGVFAQDLVRVTEAIDVSAALRLDGWRDVDGARTTTRANGDVMTTGYEDRHELQLDPRVGVVARVSDAVAIRASAYRAFRAPTLNELYRPFQVGTVLTEANPALRPETLWGAEAGPEIVAGAMVFRATGFYDRLDGAVANVTLAEPLPSGATRQRQNLGRTRVAGVELELGWRPARAWLVTVAHTFTDARVVDAPAQPALVGKRLAQDPRDRTTLAIAYDDPSVVMVSAQLRQLGRQFEDDQQMLPMAAVTLVDARLERRLAGGVSLFAIGQNLLDRAYVVGRAGVDTIGAPRTFELGLTYR